VVGRREHEPEAGVGDAPHHDLRADVEPCAERLEHVGRAGQAGRRAIAVLGDRASRARGDDRGRRRDVERPPPPARAGGVEQVVAAGVDRRGHLAHRPRQARDLVGGLPLGPQRDEEPGDLDLARAAPHDLAQHLAGLVDRQVLALGEPVDRVRQDGVGHSRKFLSRVLP
jgi:hypothetical protein